MSVRNAHTSSTGRSIVISRSKLNIGTASIPAGTFPARRLNQFTECQLIRKGQATIGVVPRGPYELKARAEAQAANRQAAIDAARTLFVEDGFHRSTLQTVADRAGLSRATMYDQFGSKFGL